MIYRPGNVTTSITGSAHPSDIEETKRSHERMLNRLRTRRVPLVDADEAAYDL